jgi:uncharacterized protein
VTLRVRVQPRAARSGLQGVREGALLVKLSAPPVDGQANEALRRYLAHLLGLAPSCVTLRRGARGRDKQMLISGLEVDVLRARLTALLEPRP